VGSAFKGDIFISVVHSGTKEQLIADIARLPEEQLREVLDFVGYLLTKAQPTGEAMPVKELDPTQDPILRFVGSISHGSLARDIDNELYGE
jgi:hypothetical protein